MRLNGKETLPNTKLLAAIDIPIEIRIDRSEMKTGDYRRQNAFVSRYRFSVVTTSTSESCIK